MRVYILIFANILDSTCSWDRGIWLLLFKFNFGLIRWPPQPPREKVPKIYKIVDFRWSIPYWETRIGHFGARVDGNIKLSTVFPHIIAAATILFWIHLVRKLFKFSFPLCNENLNSFLTRWGNYSRRGNYSREETIWGNTVLAQCPRTDLSKRFLPKPMTTTGWKGTP